MDPQESQRQAMHMLAFMVPFLLIGWAVGLAIIIIPLWQICKKAGLSAPLSLLEIVPGLGHLIVLYVVAFSEWKVVPAPQYGGFPPTYPPPPPAPNFPPSSYSSQNPTV
jgi:hypothetical protein